MEKYEQYKHTGVESHSERDIVDGCITLMKNMWKEFIDYLDYMEVDYDLDDMPSFRFSYFYIVQQLLLLHTNHSGGTSTRQKCDELGLEWSRSIEFRIDEDGEGVVIE